MSQRAALHPTRACVGALLFASIIAGACVDAPTAPIDELRIARFQRMGCVPSNYPAPPDTTATQPDGTCQSGFDQIPWW